MIKIDREFRERLYINGTYLVTEVSHEIIDEIMSWIINNRPKRKEFTILINSTGGSPSAVIRFASFVRTLESGVSIKGVAFDTCGSAALALLQCCHGRIAVKHCSFFIHHIRTSVKMSCQNLDMKKIKLELASSRMVEDELVQIQCERSGITKARWMKLADHGESDADTPILANKAKELGLVDCVRDTFPII